MKTNRYYGKYRGKVRNNIDPLLLGRLQVNVPSVMGLEFGWAMPCVPYAGRNVGFYAMPPIGANVWVEFEGGDPNYPIWAGCFWEEGEVPNEPVIPEKKVFKTECTTMILNDVEEVGGFTLEVAPPAVEELLTMVFNATGITITCPESVIKMTPENIEITTPPGIITVSGETISLDIPESSITMTAESTIVTVPPSVTTWSAEALEMAIPASTVTMTEEGMEVAAPDLNITAMTEIEGNVDITGAVELTGNLEVLGNAEINGLNVEIAAATAVEITAPACAITAAVEVTGDLLIDGQQPLVI